MNSILTADLHLLRKPGMWAGRSEIAGDDLWSLDHITKICKERNAGLYLLGDTFDSVTNLPRPIVVAQQALGALIAAGKTVRYINGQHEIVVGTAYDTYPWLSVVVGSEHIAGQEFQFHGYKAFALDYFPLAFEALNFAQVPKDTEILFLHGTIDMAMPMGFHFSLESLAKFPELKFVFAGDYHMPIEIVAGKCKLYYCGSTWMHSVAEPREKSVIMVSGDKGDNDFKIERLGLPTRTIVFLTEVCDENGVFAPEMLETFPKAKDLPKELETPVILVDMPIDKEMYVKLAEFGHVYTTSKANPDMPSKEVIDMAEKLTNEEILANHVDREKNPSEFAFTLDVIENPAGDAIGRLKEKLGVKIDDHAIQTATVSEEICLEEENPEEAEEPA